MAGDDPGARLRATFAAELADQGQLLERYALALERTPDDLALLRSALRVAHTLKGAAAAAGVPAVETLCHAAEELLGGLARGGWASPDALQGLLALADRLREFAERLGAGSSPPVAALRALQAELEAIAEERRSAPAAVPASAPAPEDGAPAPAGFRVVPGKLDRLLATAGQAQLERAALHHRLTDLEGVLEDLQAAVRGPSPVGGRVEMAALAREGARRLDQVRRATRGLHGTIDRMAWDVTRLRLRPFAEACEALPRAVRELCRATGKEVRLHVEGEEVEADREVIEALREAVLPLVRNAVDHGIESADVRTARGKPAVGEVRVQAALRGDRVVVTVSDDGGGLDVAAVGARLRAAGIEAPDDPARLAELALLTGVSSRREATLTSGRGVGLEIVGATMRRVRGTVRLAWTAGAGATVVLECPPTLAVIRVLVVRCAGHRFGLPVEWVTRMLRLDPGTIREVPRGHVLDTPEGPAPVASLARLLGVPGGGPPARGHLHAVLVDVDGLRGALLVDEPCSEEGGVLRPMPFATGRPSLAGGAIVLPSGEVAPVLDLRAVLAGGLTGSAGELAPPAPVERKRVLLVDDSPTTRTLGQGLLQGAGYDVATASDGQEGWERLEAEGADLVLTDVEMPRMDGLTLCRTIRQSTRWASLPVVLLTGRESAGHREEGLAAGADAWLGKSSLAPDTLMRVLQDLLGGGGA